VSHDLRTPLAAAKASVTSLRSSDIEWQAAERDELLRTADEALDRLSQLVDNLLDLSRLQAGVLPVFLRPTSLDEVMPAVLKELGENSSRVLVDIPHTLPLVQADPVLLERVVANLVGNAIRHAPSESPPTLTASAFGDQVQLRVVDRGPGIPPDQRDRAFVPFQRLGDTDNATGVGLGLALARGLTELGWGSGRPDRFGLSKGPVGQARLLTASFKLILSRQVMGRPFAAPPGVPEDRKQALRKAFDDSFKDPEFLAEAKKRKMDVNPVSGADIEKLVAEVYATPPEIVKEARTVITGGK